MGGNCQGDLCNPEHAQYQLVLKSMSPIQLQNFLADTDKDSMEYMPAMVSDEARKARDLHAQTRLWTNKHKCESNLLASENLLKAHEEARTQLESHKTEMSQKMDATLKQVGITSTSGLEVSDDSDEDEPATQEERRGLEALCEQAIKAHDFEVNRIAVTVLRSARGKDMTKAHRQLFSLTAEAEKEKEGNARVTNFYRHSLDSDAEKLRNGLRLVTKCSDMGLMELTSGCIPKATLNDSGLYHHNGRSEDDPEQFEPVETPDAGDDALKEPLARYTLAAQQFSVELKSSCPVHLVNGEIQRKTEVQNRKTKVVTKKAVVNKMKALKEAWGKSITKTLAAANAWTTCGANLQKAYVDHYSKAKEHVETAIQQEMSQFQTDGTEEKIRQTKYPYAHTLSELKKKEAEPVWRLHVVKPSVRFVMVAGVINATKNSQKTPQGNFYAKSMSYLGLKKEKTESFWPVFKRGAQSWRLTPVELVNKDDEAEEPQLQDIVSKANFYSITPEALSKAGVPEGWLKTPALGESIDDKSQTALQKVQLAIDRKANRGNAVFKQRLQSAREAAERRTAKEMCKKDNTAASDAECKALNLEKLTEETFLNHPSLGIRATKSLAR